MDVSEHEDNKEELEKHGLAISQLTQQGLVNHVGAVIHLDSGLILATVLLIYCACIHDQFRSLVLSFNSQQRSIAPVLSPLALAVMTAVT